jgi:hypothetical protein
LRAIAIRDSVLCILANLSEQGVDGRSEFLHDGICAIICKAFVNETFKRKTAAFTVIDTIGQQLTIEEGRELSLGKSSRMIGHS